MKTRRSFCSMLMLNMACTGLVALQGCGHPATISEVAQAANQLAQAPAALGQPAGPASPAQPAQPRVPSQPAAAAQPATPALPAVAIENPFPNAAPAPALEGGVGWFNTSQPVDLKNLHGKFVLLDFWTYCCINCMHILPELKKIEHAYPNNVVVIGVHSGKFDAEHDSENIRQAILRNDIEHPVVNDADYKIWNAYHCESWPSLRLIDPNGNLVAEQGGEVDFATLDTFFKKMLPYYRQQTVLNEKPIHFDLEKNKAANTPLLYPGKILADEPGGRLFIADSNHNRIVVAGLDGKLQQVIGSGDIGRADGDFRTAQFHHPQGMALQGDTLYVADTENHLLRKVDLKNQRVVTIAGIGEESRFGWPGVDQESGNIPERFVGPPLKTALNSPWALWIHGKDLYIAMAGAHQIWKMPLDESEIGPYAGNGREDIVDGPLLPKRPYAVGYASFAQPSGLSSDGIWLIVADSEGSSVRAVPFDPTKEVGTLIGTADIPAGRLFTFGDVDGANGTARLQHCLDVAYHDSKIYVADTYNNKIKEIDLKTGLCKTLAGSGQVGHDGSAGSTAPVGGNVPGGNASGTNPSGASASSSSGASSGDASAIGKMLSEASHPASFSQPAGLTYAGGKLYVADTNNSLIRIIELSQTGDKTAAVTPRVSTLTITGLEPPPSTLPALQK